jgi:Ribulose-phosphate 3 epimerase family
VAAAAALLAERGHRITVHIDGGVNRDTAAIAGAWGAEVCVVGSALFQRSQDAADEVALVRERVTEGRRLGPDALEPPRRNSNGSLNNGSSHNRALHDSSVHADR